MYSVNVFNAQRTNFQNNLLSYFLVIATTTDLTELSALPPPRLSTSRVYASAHVTSEKDYQTAISGHPHHEADSADETQI